ARRASEGSVRPPLAMSLPSLARRACIPASLSVCAPAQGGRQEPQRRTERRVGPLAEPPRRVQWTRLHPRLRAEEPRRRPPPPAQPEAPLPQRQPREPVPPG